MPDLNHFLNQNLSADDVAHSNGYANVAGGAGAGGLSMDERRKRLNRPRVIGEYAHSRLGRQSSAIKAKTADQEAGRVYDASSGTFSDNANMSNREGGGIKDSSQIDTKSIEKRQHYIEPPSRGYDKYA